MFNLAQDIAQTIRQVLSIWPSAMLPAPIMQGADPSISVTNLIDLVTKGGALGALLLFAWGFIKKDPWFAFYRELERVLRESEKKDATIEVLNQQLNRLTGVAEKIVEPPSDQLPPTHRKTPSALRVSARRREGEKP